MRIGPVYKLQIVDAQGHEVVTFAGRGPVERDLVGAISQAVAGQVPGIAAKVLEQGRWWLRPSALERAVVTALQQALPGIVGSAVDDVLMAVKQDASTAHLGHG